MRKLMVFDSVTLDGYFTDARGDMGWAHKSDPEWDAFTNDNARNADGTMVFGRKTYELMASWWPTPAAAKAMPEVAASMNAAPKVVFSRTLQKASWDNTQLLKGELSAEIRKLKQAPGGDLVIMGSGTLVSQLTQAGLIDEYQLVLNPIVLGKGRTLFEGVIEPRRLRRTKLRAFENGNVVMWFEPS